MPSNKMYYLEKVIPDSFWEWRKGLYISLTLTLIISGNETQLQKGGKGVALESYSGPVWTSKEDPNYWDFCFSITPPNLLSITI